MNKIYLVIFQYSANDADGIDTQAFDTYEKAVNRFYELIEAEKQPDMSWASVAFEGGKLDHCYELDCSDFTDGQEHELVMRLKSLLKKEQEVHL